MVRKQCFLVCPPVGNNVSCFEHLRETWLGNNVSWFVHLREQCFHVCYGSYLKSKHTENDNACEYGCSTVDKRDHNGVFLTVIFHWIVTCHSNQTTEW
jgi:hypothetical protein